MLRVFQFYLFSFLLADTISIMGRRISSCIPEYPSCFPAAAAPQSDLL
jgi:hypothetical protein